MHSSVLAVVVLVGTAGVSYALLKVFRPEPTRPAAPPLRNGMIAFVASTSPGQPGNYDIFAVNPDGTGVEHLTDDPAPDYSPAWSPDGTQIAFARERRHNPGGDASTSIYVMNADGEGETRVTTEEGVHDGSPSWSPDGSMIAFSSNREGFSDIWVVNSDGTGLRRLTDLSQKGVDYAGLPAWSPDGSVIAFRRSPLEPSGELQPQGIWGVDVGSGELLQLTSGPILDEDASWAPDGQRIAFSRKIWTGSEVYTDVYVANLDEGTETTLTRGGDPAWSPDGTRIAFSGGRHRPEFGIYIMDTDGSDVIQIATPPELGSSPISPTWQPLPRGESEGADPSRPPSTPTVSGRGFPSPQSQVGEVTEDVESDGDGPSGASREVRLPDKFPSSFPFPAGTTSCGGSTWVEEGRSLFRMCFRVAASYDDMVRFYQGALRAKAWSLEPIAHGAEGGRSSLQLHIRKTSRTRAGSLAPGIA